MNHTILNVNGELSEKAYHANGLLSNQRWKSETRLYGNGKSKLYVEMRFDDTCKNGHMSFGITATGYDKLGNGRWENAIGGCCHDEIAKVFPELKPLITWHLHSTDGALHGVANAVYHASNRDYNGLLKGEKKQIINGRTGLPSWKLVAVVNGVEQEHSNSFDKYFHGDQSELPDAPLLKWVKWCHVGEGKERNLQAARDCFPTVEFTDQQLMQERPELIEMFKAALPKTIADFKVTMTGCGFEWRVLS